MARLAANRRLPMAMIATLLLAGCATDQASPSTSAGASTAAPVLTGTPILTPIPTQTATPTTAATPAPTVAPAPAVWQEVPAQASVSGVQFQDIVWTGTHFVAIGWALDGAGVFLDSTDGLAWHRQASLGPDAHPARLAVGPGGIIATGSMGERSASWLSADGLTWKARTNAFPMPGAGSDSISVTDVVAVADGWLAVGHRDPYCNINCQLEPIRSYIWTSTDGFRWTRLADQASLKGGGMDTVARSSAGYVAAGTDSGHAAIWTSPDGSAWSRVPNARKFYAPDPSAGGRMPAVAIGAAAHDGVIVVIGSVWEQDPSAAGIVAWWSTDGRTWANASIEASREAQFNAVAATPDGFIAVGRSNGCVGGVWSSTDGQDWRCDASGKGMKGFSPWAAAASDTLEVAVGMTDAGYDEESGTGIPGDAWSRALR